MKWIIVVAFFAASCGKKPQCWSCKSNYGTDPVCNKTRDEIKEIERQHKANNMKCTLELF